MLTTKNDDHTRCSHGNDPVRGYFLNNVTVKQKEQQLASRKYYSN